ncbi:MAG: MBL fold metallo-hydrolase [Actinomycetia bacterium]|nr:MBL fold metallo-hydrolase [Actinomycetes bacterium]
MESRTTYDVSRRRFLRSVGTGAIGVAIFGIAAAACSSENTGVTTTGAATGATTGAPTTTAGISTTTATVVSTTGASATDLVSSRRVDLDFVSAYVIERGDGLVVIDTGASGSAPAIEAVLGEYGKSWSDVGYVIATHKHGDHVGSWNPVIDAASGASIFAGGLDIPSIASGRPITVLADGDMVNGLATIATPGHTQGHISMLDPVLGLFTGDALNGSDGGVIGPNPQFTPDMDTALESVRRLGTFEYEAAFFGHGEPLLSGASVAVQALVESL